jgi:hypothetical protein
MGDTSFAHLSVHAGTDAHAACASYRYDPPILSVHAGGICLNVSAQRREELTASDVKFASELAEAAAKYAAECARVHAAQAHRAAPLACDCAEGEAAASTSAGEPA